VAVTPTVISSGSDELNRLRHAETTMETIVGNLRLNRNTARSFARAETV